MPAVFFYLLLLPLDAWLTARHQNQLREFSLNRNLQCCPDSGSGSGDGTECPLWLTLEFNYGLSPGGGLKRVISATYNWKGLKRYARTRVLHIPYVLSGPRQMSQLPPPPPHWQAELKIILKKKRNTHTHKVNFTLRLNETKRELHVYENPFIDLQIQLNKRGNKVCQGKLNLHWYTSKSTEYIYI